MAEHDSRDNPPKTRFIQLNDSDVAAMTDSGSFSRGRTYFRQGRIHDPSIQGNTIEAECDGSEYEPYLVRATILAEGQNGANPSSYSCTCPRGGFCKHVVALLLTWIDSPQSFQPTVPVSELLAGRSTGELIGIIEAMVARHRDLRSLVELQVATSNASPNVAGITLTVIRREVKRVLAQLVATQYDGTYRHLRALPMELEGLLDRMHGWAEDDAWANVQAVCSMLLTELAETLPSLRDDEGVLAGLAYGCQELLSTTFAIQPDLPETDRLAPEARLAAFKSLFDIWRLDIFVLGGVDLGGLGPEIIVQFASPEELDQVQAWLDSLPEGEGWSRNMSGEFRNMIWDASGLTDAELYERFRETGLWQSAFDKLIEMGRYEDAMSTARNHLRTFPEIMDAMTDMAALGPDWKAQAIQVIEDFAWEVEGKKPLDDAKLKVWLNKQRGTSPNRNITTGAKPRQRGARPPGA